MSLTCPSCGNAVPADRPRRYCGVCGALLPSSGESLTSPAAPLPSAPPKRHAGSPESSRFLPGAIVAGRYRMIGLLGKGGMGEVYRADDMKLGQAVALKFLPADVERDPERLERFLTEVRMSLRVTHPNICRVFDIGQLDDPSAGFAHRRHFLSMEYVDGEDLASLLRRIGRLPEDKAVEIARQLCAGLAAAHDEGVLHRDLKPANIMIDGRGRAKIADFGLAGGADAGISGAEARAGTPQYMAPEQVAGGTLTERTDIYALGLVLYELFTGKRAFEIRSLDDLQRLATSTPTSPSSHVSGLNPLVERAILRCLEPDPAKRPTSASALAAALPGGDPLAMAIAAGDTPSPEMVAAAGSDAGLRPAVAWPLLILAIAGAVAVAALGRHVVTTRVGAPVKAPAVLVERAREVLRAAGQSDPLRYSAWGLQPSVDFLNHVEARRPLDPQDTQARRSVTFWYRESPVTIERLAYLQPDLTARVTSADPPLRFSGEARVILDGDGRLVDLTLLPPQVVESAVPPGPEADWSALFRLAGLDPAAWVGADPRWTPLFHADRQVAWTPRDPGVTSPLRVEAASFQGTPVNFQIIYPWTSAFRMTATRRTQAQRIANLVMVLIFTVLMVSSFAIARRNLRLDRADRKGALRLGVVVAALTLLAWAIDESHVPTIWELYLFFMAASWALFSAVLISAFYLALEPYVRRSWPAVIMSWSRLWPAPTRDPLVARDVLIGCAAGVLLGLVTAAGHLTTQATTGVLPRLLTFARPFFGPQHTISEVATGLIISVFWALACLFMLVSMRRLVRSTWLATVLVAAILAVPAAIGDTGALRMAPFIFLGQGLAFAVLARIGLVAAITAFTIDHGLRSFPFTWPMSEWYSGVGLVGVVITAGLAIWGFRVATAAHTEARQAAGSN